MSVRHLTARHKKAAPFPKVRGFFACQDDSNVSSGALPAGKSAIS